MLRLFLLQMFQLPLIAASKYLKRKGWLSADNTLENTGFWACLLIGSPLILYVYSQRVFSR